MNERDVRTERKVIELSHILRHGMRHLPGAARTGDPRPHDPRSAPGNATRPAPSSRSAAITLVANTGTYLDTPFHRYPDGPTSAELDLTRLADVPGVLIDAPPAGSAGIGPDAFGRRHRDRAGRADPHRLGPALGNAAYGAAGHPHLTEAAAWLVEHRPAVVGIDSVNIDDMAAATRPAHTALLAAGIPIVEHMRGLGQLSGQRFRFHAAPVAVAGMGTFPVRAYALLDAETR